MLGGDVVLLAEVFFQIKELELLRRFRLPAQLDALPLADAHGLVPVFGLWVLPVKILPLLLLTLAGQGRQQGNTGVLGRHGLIEQVTDRGKDVIMRTGQGTDGAGLDGPRPTGHGRGTNPPLEEIALVAAQRAVGVPEPWIMTTLQMRAIVRREQDQGVFSLAGFLKQLKQPANLVVEVFHHGGVAGDRVLHVRAGLTGAGTVFADFVLKLGVDFTILLMQFLGRVHGRVGHSRRDVAEEGLARLGVFFHKGKGVIHNQVMDVGALLEGFFLAVAHDGCRVIGVGDHLAFPGSKLIKTVAQGVGCSSIIGYAQAPLAIHAGGVAGGFEDLGQHGHFLAERQGVFIAIATGKAMTGVLAGHQGVARWGADGIRRVMIGELDALRGETIDVGCLEFLLPKARQITVAEVISEDVDDIGGRACRGTLALRALGRWSRRVNGEE